MAFWENEFLFDAFGAQECRPVFVHKVVSSGREIACSALFNYYSKAVERDVLLLPCGCLLPFMIVIRANLPHTWWDS